MPPAPDNHDDHGDGHIYRSGHERRMEELEQELEVARKQADIEKARAEAVVSHLAVENQQLRRRQPAAPQQSPRRGNPAWRLAGHCIGRLGSMFLGLLSCLSFILLLVLAYAYWPEIAAMLGMEQLGQGGG